jgi:CBS domain containing-hemolysin-like protein
LFQLKTNVNRPLAAILTLNTVANTVGAVGVGAEVQALFGSAALTVASVILTLLILFVSEIMPKTLGAVYWRNLAVPIAHFLPYLIYLLYPFVRMAEVITRAIKRKPTDRSVSRDEFTALARLSVQQGLFAESESRVLINLFHLGELNAHDVMTPRTVLFTLNEDTPVGDAMSDQGTLPFSRIPIWKGSVDHITGYVLKNRLLVEAAQGNASRLIKEFAREVLIVPSSLSVPILFERLLSESEHFAVVVDEYGGIEGLVTMEDVLETLLGMEIIDEKDRVHNMRAMARERWSARTKALQQNQAEESK